MRLVLEQKLTISEAARGLAMSDKTFANWVLRAWRGQRCSGLPNSKPVRDLETEVSRLRRELVEVRKDLSM